MRRLLISFAFLVLLAVPASAQMDLAPSLGIFDLGKGENAVEAGLELRLRPYWLRIQPVVGGMVTSDESAYGYVGMRRDFRIDERWSVTPSFGAGAYHRGDGKDLGRTLEFRSGLEIAMQIRRGRLGLVYYHLSNASLSDTNPGSESLVLSWELPLSR